MTGATDVAFGAWDWQASPVLWAVVGATGAAVAVGHRRLQRTSDNVDDWPRKRIHRFVGALIVTVLALGWPLGDLAAHWSLTALVLQRSILTLAVAPLLLTGLPDDVLHRMTRPAAIDWILIRITRPPAAVVFVTAVLVGSMAPALVAAQASSAVARGLLAGVVIAAGLVLWLPIIGRVPGIPRPRPMIRAVYLVAQAVVPVFLSFVFILATHPIYPVFAGSKGVFGLRPLNDQQVAGFVSKLSFLITLLTVAAVTLARAPDSDEDLGPEDPLVWADIERHFERADRGGRAAPAEPTPIGASGRSGTLDSDLPTGEAPPGATDRRGTTDGPGTADRRGTTDRPGLRPPADGEQGTDQDPADR